MNNFSISNDIIPVGEFKSGLAKYLKKVQEDGNSLVITQNGKASGVLISPVEFDEMQRTKNFINSISRGLLDSENGDSFSSKELKAKLAEFRA